MKKDEVRRTSPIGENAAQSFLAQLWWKVEELWFRNVLLEWEDRGVNTIINESILCLATASCTLEGGPLGEMRCCRALSGPSRNPLVTLLPVVLLISKQGNS